MFRPKFAVKGFASALMAAFMQSMMPQLDQLKKRMTPPRKPTREDVMRRKLKRASAGHAPHQGEREIERRLRGPHPVPAPRKMWHGMKLVYKGVVYSAYEPVIASSRHGLLRAVRI